MSLLRFLGLDHDRSGRESEPASLIELGAQLEGLPEDEARLAAAFTYLLARVAGADLRTEAPERASIAERLGAFADLQASQAELLADTAIRVADLHGASDHHLVARAYRDMSSHVDRLRLLRCLYAVAAADDTITTVEDNQIFEIATEIGVGRNDVIAIRSEWKNYLGTMKALPGEQ